MKKLTILMFAVVALASCRKQPDLSQLSNDPIVATPHDPNADFTKYKTYYIPDYIALVNSDKPLDTIWDDANAQKLIQRIKDNMNSRGFVYTPLASNPDLVMPSVAVKVTNTAYYGGYYWGYPGYWDPYYWGGGYYYYPYTYTYEYNTGAFVFEIADRKNVIANNDKIVLLWTGFLGGYMSDNTGSNMGDALAGIDQAFSQSPYIKAGN